MYIIKEFFMRRTLLVLALLTSTTAFAQHGHWVYRNGGWGWMAPAVVGGVIGYELARPPVYATAPVVVQQPVIVEQQQVIQPAQQQCSPWTQTQNPDGSITSTRTCR
jgi:hypothetical protein